LRLVPTVVLDTSTLVSAALRPGSVPSVAFRQSLARFEVATCDATLDELDRVLRRPKFNRYLPLDDRMQFVELVRRYGRPFTVSTDHLTASRSCPDPKDAVFLALALACSARVLVSSDADLLGMHPFQGIDVLTPAAFVQLLDG